MKNERNPEIGSVGSGMQKRLLNFARALSKNDEDVYEYILLMVRGDFKSQENSCDCIFAHLRNILSSEMNTNVLKYASRFITTLLLIGNLHIYQKFIAYLLPVFKQKIQEQKGNHLRPVWPLQLFCRELLFIMAQWLPHDFYKSSLPSPFAIAVAELGIQCQEFRFMNVDKIIISYRIIKALGLDQSENDCRCQNCRLRLTTHHHTPIHHSNQQMREKLYLLHSKRCKRDELFETGFEISVDEVSGLEDMMEQKLKSFSAPPPQDSLIFLRLRQKMEVLEDDIHLLKSKCTEAHSQSKKQSFQQQDTFETPKKVGSPVKTISPAGSSSKSRKLFSPKADLLTMKSLPNLELLPLQVNFEYSQYDLFRGIGLSGDQLQAFKYSLLCLQEKIYLQKDSKISIYCLALAKAEVIKIRVCFQGEQRSLTDYSVDMDNPSLNCRFNEEKYEFTVKLTHYLEALRIVLKSPKGQLSIILPVGHIKLLEPLPDSAVEEEKLTFKFIKTIKLQNIRIRTYQQLVSQLTNIEKLLQKTHSTKITRIMDGQKLKKKLHRRYRLFETEMVLLITNNHTQYIDVEVHCLDMNIHRRNACSLLKEIIFICSPP